MSKSKKNGRVEFLRFIFALAILFFHIHKRFYNGHPITLGDTPINFFSRGYIGVEFFFLVSGYLLAASVYSKREKPVNLLGTETALMMKKKFLNIFPYHLFGTILTMVVNAYFLEHTFQGRAQYVADSWASVFLLQVFGFDSSWVNKLTWYLDVWLMVTFIFYPLLRKYYDTFVKIVCPLLALFVLGYMAHEYHSIAGVDSWTGMFYKCFLRGLAEMALGCSAYSLSRQIKKYDFSKAGRIFLGVIEACCYIMVFIYACTPMDPKYSYPILFLLWIGVILSFSDINPAAGIFDKPIFTWLGGISLTIYLNQFYSIRLVQELMPKGSFPVKVIMCTLVTFIGAFVCEKVVGWFKKNKPISRLIFKISEDN